MADVKTHRLGTSKAQTNYQNNERKENLLMTISSLTGHKTNSIALKLEHFKHLKIAPPSEMAQISASTLKRSKELLQLPPCSTKSKGNFKDTNKQTKETLIISKPTKKQQKTIYGMKRRFLTEKRVFKINNSSLTPAEFRPNGILSEKTKNRTSNLTKSTANSFKIAQSLPNKTSNENQEYGAESLKLNSTKSIPIFEDEALQCQQSNQEYPTQDAKQLSKAKNCQESNGQEQVPRKEKAAENARANALLVRKLATNRDGGHHNLSCVVWDSKLKPKTCLPPVKITRLQSPEEAAQLLPFCLHKNGQQNKANILHTGYKSVGKLITTIEWISMFKSKGFRPGSSRSFPTKGELELMKCREWVEDNPLCYTAKYAKYIGVESRQTKSRGVMRLTSRFNSI